MDCTGRITEVREDGVMVIEAPCPSFDELTRKKVETVRIELLDGRPLSGEQRRMCYALIREVADWMGEEQEAAKEQLKHCFREEPFSLSNASMSLVCEFQDFLIKFILSNEIPTDRPLYEYAEDGSRYLYHCAMTKRCAVCGRRADLHHVKALGMGVNRNEVVHEGMEVMPLCRRHHIEAHSIGQKEFLALYHFDGGVTADKRICKVYGLKDKKEEE